MAEVTASKKIVLGSVAAAAALITGLLGNVLAANISAVHILKFPDIQDLETGSIKCQ